jgi:hypothetical protein
VIQGWRRSNLSKKCWLIADWNGRVPTLAAQFARLRGFTVQYCPNSDGVLPPVSAEARPLIAASFAMLARTSPRDKEQLRALIEAGATLYLRGGLAYGHRHSLMPLINSSFVAGAARDVQAYRFTRHLLIPPVLRGERATPGMPLNCACDVSGPAEPLLFAYHADGSQSPVIFSYRIGQGTIICDVQQEDETADTPIAWRLADAGQRCINVGALMAADRAGGFDTSRPVPFNLTIDDVPLKYDFLNEPVLERFLDHVEKVCPGAHLDCAWIPTNQRMSHRYVDILKSHGAGFVWHGLHRHVNHRNLENPATEIDAGLQAIDRIKRRFGVDLQPIMIFPYENCEQVAEELLLREGFVAGAEQPHEDENVGEDDMTTGYLRYSTPGCAHDSGLHFLHRYESWFLTRDRMLAMVALGLPILAFAHPRDLGLRRLARFMDRGGSFSHFDSILEFAREKGLLARSLEGIAREVFAQTPESTAQQACA